MNRRTPLGKNRQRGSMGGIMVTLLIVAASISMGSQLIPLYLDHNTMGTIMDKMALENGLALRGDGEVRGILLIDELEQHLHPTMQRELLAQLERALPHVQIIVTTHSPLIALAAQHDQLVSLHRDGPRIYLAEVPRLDGYSAEDVLVEKALFGTDPYAPMTRRQLDRQMELARILPEDRLPQEVEELRRRGNQSLADSIEATGPETWTAK